MLMYKQLDLLCILLGCIFYGFGLKWCYEYAKFWVSLKPRNDQRLTKTIRFWERCGKFLREHPVEGTLKLIVTAVGLVLTLANNDMSERILVSSKVVYATIYMFFALSGLVDVLNFYFPQNISDSLVKMALAQSFFIEGLLWNYLDVYGTAYTFSSILAQIVWVTALAVILEIAWPETKLLRASTTLIHGQWIIYMVLKSGDLMRTEEIILAFSWHIAGASTVTLIIVGLTRIWAPLTVEEPPEIPIYDCYQRPDQRM